MVVPSVKVCGADAYIGAVTPAEKVFAPAKVCVAVVTIPPKFAFAGDKINCVVPLIVAPSAYDVPEIGPTELNPALEAVMDAATNAVVANLVELSPVVCVMPVVPVGKIGVPVNDGEFKFALLLKDVFNVAISEVLEVILDVAELTLDVKVVMSDMLVVILDVFVFTFAVSVLILFVFEVILDVFAATEVGKLAMVDELTPPTLFTVVAKLPVPIPETSPVNLIV
jgi:hypothetical protein